MMDADRTLNREKLSQMQENFKAFIEPFLNENDAQDYHLVWEWQKFLHAKKLQVLTAEGELLKRWKESLLNK